MRCNVTILLLLFLSRSTAMIGDEPKSPVEKLPPGVDAKILEQFRKSNGPPQLTEPYKSGDIGRGGKLPLHIVTQGIAYIDLSDELGEIKMQSIRLKGFKTADGVSGQKVTIADEIIKVTTSSNGSTITIEPFDAKPYLMILAEEKKKRDAALAEAQRMKEEAKAIEAAKKEAAKKAAAESPEGREKAATSKLNLAKTLRKTNADKAKSRFQEIVSEYPETKAGIEAAKVLKYWK